MNCTACLERLREAADRAESLGVSIKLTVNGFHVSKHWLGESGRELHAVRMLSFEEFHWASINVLLGAIAMVDESSRR